MRVPSARYVSQSRIASPKGSSRINRQLTHLRRQTMDVWELAATASGQERLRAASKRAGLSLRKALDAINSDLQRQEGFW